MFKKSVKKKCLFAILITALYGEWLIYIIQPWYWPRLRCERDDWNCTRILFIADPQIQGEEAVVFPLSSIVNWDSDRYLRVTFLQVMKHFKPDVLVFMGDVMDEGSIATSAQFTRYSHRIENIFEVERRIKRIWIPGDNDIGGENEPIKKDKVNEFNRIYNQPPVMRFNNISFYKVNAITYQIPNKVVNDDLNIVISHYPITASNVFGQMVNKALHPDIYFCAHDHESKYVKQTKDLQQKERHKLEYGGKILDIPINNQSLYEIYVPTCSYRMGTSKIGYGAAIYERNEQRLRYTVLWSPQRFPFLFIYLTLIILILIYILYKVCYFFCCIMCANRRPFSVDVRWSNSYSRMV